MNKDAQSPDPVSPGSPAEFGCWAMVVLAPILTWFNGPAVSTDQFVVRVTVFGIALVGAIGIRVGKIIRRRLRPRQ